ncbi:MAG: Bug family tripartite tricarboxylate transporter substrate binding protein [Burkholderiales bacterium]
MPLLKRMQRTLILMCAALAAGPALAQEYPVRPIRIISPSAPGGITDLIARIIGDRLAIAVKQPVIIENKPGGTGAVALDFVAKSPPDGYNLVVGFAGANVIYPQINDKLPFNAQRDFTPITQVSSGGNVLVVHPSVPVNNLKEFLAYARAQTKPPPYGSWGPGSGGHLAGEYLKILTGVQMFHVPYKSTTALTTEVVGGHMQLAFLDSFNAIAQSRAGKVRSIAQAGPTRSPMLANVPTLQEEGVDFSVGVWTGIFGPANLPRPIVTRLHVEIDRILRAPDLTERWLNILGYPTAPTTPEEFARIIARDWDIWKRVVVEGKIKGD